MFGFILLMFGSKLKMLTNTFCAPPSQVLSAAQMLSSDSNRLKLEVGKFLDSVRVA